MIEKITDRIDRFLRWFLVTLMAIMVVTVTWQVLTRYVLGTPSSYTMELSTFLLIWITLLGSAYALRLRAHLGIDVVVRALSDRGKEIAGIAVHVAIIVASLVIFIYGGSRLVYVTLVLNQLSPAFQIPMGYVYSVVPITGVLMVYYAVVAINEHRVIVADPGAGSV